MEAVITEGGEAYKFSLFILYNDTNFYERGTHIFVLNEDLFNIILVKFFFFYIHLIF